MFVTDEGINDIYLVYYYLAIKKEQNTETCNSMNES